MLASDADRDRVADRLRQAATEGRILAQELEERVSRALRARTYGELDELVADLPGSGSPERRRSRSRSLARSHPLAAVGVLVAVTLVLFVVAAALAMFAFSGVWVAFLLVFLLARRGPRSGGPGGYRRPRGSDYGPRRGRYPYWVR
jgi:Flp pilus assembly protein TadB